METRYITVRIHTPAPEARRAPGLAGYWQTLDPACKLWLHRALTAVSWALVLSLLVS